MKFARWPRRSRRPWCLPRQRGARHRPRGHALVDVRRRGGGGRRVRQGLRRHRQQVGRRRHRRLRRHRAADHDQPHHRRRPDGRHHVQPRPPGRGAGRGRADAQPRRRRQGRELGGGRQPAVAARGLHARRPPLLRAGQHPRLAVALALQQGLRDAGVPVPTNWDEFVAAGPALQKAGIQPLAVGAAGLAASGPLQQPACSAIGGKDLYLKVYDEKDADAAGRAGDGEGLEGGRRRPQARPRARTCRTGTRRPTW